MYLRYLLVEFHFVVVRTEQKAQILALFLHPYSREWMREVWFELKVERQFILEDNVAFDSNWISACQFDLNQRLVLNFLDFSELKLALHVGVAPLVLAIAFTSHIYANLLKRSAQYDMFIAAFEPVIRSCLLFHLFHESHKPAKLFIRFIAIGIRRTWSVDAGWLTACHYLAPMHGLPVGVSSHRHIEAFHFVCVNLIWRYNKIL